MAQTCLPTFFVIGAAKCGTQSLHKYLDEHPEISMSLIKEPCVYSEPRWLDKHEDYEGQFDRTVACRGESTTGYTRYPVEGDAAPLIHQAVPDAKLIYLIRDPIDRILSDFVHHSTAGWEPRPINEALRTFEDPENYYVCTSRYWMQVERYLDRFDASSLLVLEQADLRERRASTMAAIFSFLDVDPGFSSPEFQIETDRREDNVSYEGVVARLRRSALGRGFRKLPARQRLPVSRAIRRLLRTVPRPELDPALESELRDFLAPEYDRVRGMARRASPSGAGRS